MSFNSYQAIQYFKFLKDSKKKISDDHLFLSELLDEILNDEKFYYDFEDLEKSRKSLLEDSRTIEVTDFGAGSKKMNSNNRIISDIAKNSLTRRKFSQLLYRLANRIQPSTIIELGTSLGLQTSYFAKACPKAEVISFEGCPNIIHEAKRLHDSLKISNVKLVKGNMNETLNAELKHLKKVDLAFVDGNHTYEATMRYCQLLKDKSHDDSVWIIDDIHWSEGMTKAWNDLKKESDSTVSIDLFYMGLIFFKKDIEPTDLKIWY